MASTTPLPAEEEDAALDFDIEFNQSDRPEPMCRHVMERRRDAFQLLSFDEYVALGLLVRWQDFKRLKKLKPNLDIQKLARLAVSKLRNLRKSWPVFWRAQAEPQNRSLVLLEATFYFVNCDLTNVSERKRWLSRCSGQLAAFNLEPGAKGRKRKREQDDSDLRAETAVVSEVRSFLGTYLCMGFKNCCERQREIAQNKLSLLTRAIELHFAHGVGEDFKLFVTLSSSAGRALEEAFSENFDGLGDMVSDWLFGALLSSQAQATTGECLSFSLHGNGEDIVVEMKIGFTSGMELLKKMFP